MSSNAMPGAQRAGSGGPENRGEIRKITQGEIERSRNVKITIFQASGSNASSPVLF